MRRFGIGTGVISFNGGKTMRREGQPLTIAWCHTADSGGSKRAAFEMVRELARRGHVIDEYILRIGEPNLQHWPLTPYVRHSYRWNVQPIANHYRPYALAAWMGVLQERRKTRTLTVEFQKLSHELTARGYDYVHIDHCFPSYTVQLSQHLSLPSIVYTHEATDARFLGQGMIDVSKRSPWQQYYAKLCNLAIARVAAMQRQSDVTGLRGAGKVLTNSCYSREALWQRHQLSSAVCRYGVDSDTFKPLGLPRTRAVLSAGRIVEGKQHHIVIEAVGTIAEPERPTVIVATPEMPSRQEDPDYFHRLEQRAKDLHVRLEVRRNPSETDLVRLYNEVMALVFMPRMEPFGLVALEAMACGTPVIGVREGGVRESVLDGVTGLLVERNIGDVGKAIQCLIGSDELRERLGAQAARHVKQEWVWERTVDRYVDEVSSLLSQSTPLTPA
ncbi:MAG TPA: glycosyltransferase family 4 protein [Nitrospira sp.]|nr:glycosyltransferase family 4 protein [Nitrospira sp.]